MLITPNKMFTNYHYLCEKTFPLFFFNFKQGLFYSITGVPRWLLYLFQKSIHLLCGANWENSNDIFDTGLIANTPFRSINRLIDLCSTFASLRVRMYAHLHTNVWQLIGCDGEYLFGCEKRVLWICTLRLSNFIVNIYLIAIRTLVNISLVAVSLCLKISSCEGKNEKLWLWISAWI